VAEQLAPLYDVEQALREAARSRRKRDALTEATTQIADDLASHLARHFGPEGLETAGLALVIAAASAGALATKDIPPAVLCNVLAYAGQRMVGDARAADGAT
jgi:hypothetical protein